ncbi:MAG: hypothetical protein KDE31_21445, partial [Caldilineaceae bacterium]|nr:hypothetical protein [Caldilineaceae bacterium]
LNQSHTIFNCEEIPMSDSFLRPRHPLLLIATAIGFLLVSLAFFGSASAATTLLVDPSNCASGSGNYCSIQAAINAATPGDTVFITDGTYVEKLTIYKPLTLQGESRAGVLINASSFTGYAIDAQGDYAFVLKSFTLDGPDSDASGNYGLKVWGNNATAIIEDISVVGTGRSGIDLNGLSGGTVRNVSSVGALSGVGIALSDCSNIVLDSITTNNNAWGGVAIYTRGEYATGGSDNISLTGVNSFGEPVPFYIEVDNFTTPASPYAVTNFTQSFFPYLVTNSLIPTYTFYSTTAASASALANALPSLTAPQPDKSTVTVLPTGSIQAAIDAADAGDTIKVAAGTYVEQPLITKNLTLIGEGSGTVIRAPPT